MVAQFLGLKLRLLANTFKRSPWQIAGITIALVYGLATSAFVVASLIAAIIGTAIAVSLRRKAPTSTSTAAPRAG